MGIMNQNQWILARAFIWTISFVIPFSSHSMMGKYVSKDYVPNSACVLTVKDFVCTATVIAPDLLLTAAHCVDKNRIKNPQKKLPISVKCKKNKRIKALKMDYPSNDLTKESSYITKDQAMVLDDLGNAQVSLRRKWAYNNSDVAIIKLQKSLKDIPPQKLITSEEEAMGVIEQAKFCGFFGAGVDNHENIGVVRGISFKDFNQNLPIDIYLQRNFRDFLTKGKKQGIRPGDSGGPLSCLSQNGIWSVLSVHQNLDKGHEWTGRSRSIFKDENWILETIIKFN